MMPRIAILDGGTSYHHRALRDPRYRHFFAATIYVRELVATRLEEFDVVIVPDRTHPGLLRSAKAQFEHYLSRGGTVVAFGENEAHTWLPGICWCYRPTNFWWWKDPRCRLGLFAAAPEHPLFEYLPLAHATWHFHGVFNVPAGARSVIAVENDGAILYEDDVTTPGKMIVSSLDPFYHYGSYFMPVTGKFLDGFLAWIHQSCRRLTEEQGA